MIKKRYGSAISMYIKRLSFLVDSAILRSQEVYRNHINSIVSFVGTANSCQYH